jgi:hypothetical protein
MIFAAEYWCDLLKIGLEAGKKYDKKELQRFFNHINQNCCTPIYWKDNILKTLGIERNSLPKEFCVSRDYNLFEPEKLIYHEQSL